MITQAHAHKCGYTALGQLADYGCGCVWTHVRNPQRMLPQDHMCPKCGCGPFTRLYPQAQTIRGARLINLHGVLVTPETAADLTLEDEIERGYDPYNHSGKQVRA